MGCRDAGESRSPAARTGLLSLSAPLGEGFLLGWVGRLWLWTTQPGTIWIQVPCVKALRSEEWCQPPLVTSSVAEGKGVSADGYLTPVMRFPGFQPQAFG